MRRLLDVSSISYCFFTLPPSLGPYAHLLSYLPSASARSRPRTPVPVCCPPPLQKHHPSISWPSLSMRPLFWLLSPVSNHPASSGSLPYPPENPSSTHFSSLFVQPQTVLQPTLMQLGAQGPISPKNRANEAIDPTMGQAPHNPHCGPAYTSSV